LNKWESHFTLITSDAKYYNVHNIINVR